MNKLDILKVCPKTKEIIENKKSQPTDKERIEALETAIAELMIMQTGGTE